MAAMDGGGIAAMEIVARDLKAMGLYTARALSFAASNMIRSNTG